MENQLTNSALNSRRRSTFGITTGEKHGAEAITEPTGGSDLFGMMRTRAEKRNSKFVLNGQKRFVVGCTGADFFVTYAVTDPAAKPRTKV
ncbi:MAG: acyl-CoA dehydrogenase family protein [Conexivisphaerales archaeon]|nr:acyl-CoA dehydrogenase family protein [Conexivisphaerales archaeon]